MQFILQPWQLLLCVLAGWMQREQQAVIEYLRTENQVLREHVRRKRLVLTDDQRRRLAVQGRILGRKRLAEFGTLFTPDTILRWHRLLVARKWDTSAQRSAVVGRPRVAPEIVELVLRLAQENPSWGYDRIVGAVKNLGFDVSDQTVGNILREHGEAPAPDRRPRTTWKTFLLAHWDALAAIDFTTVEVWTRSGLVTFYLLFAMELTTRRVHFAGCTASPNEAWMKQTARELTSAGDGFLEGKQYLIMDRDTKFSAAFRDVLAQADIESVVLPPRSPNLNAHLERFFGSLKAECLDRMIFFGEDMLRRTVREYVQHYHEERNHQGLDNTIIAPGEEVGRTTGPIECRERLGGVLRYYHRRAA